MRKSFYIIDGHAQIFRSYFAPFRELTSPTGEPVKATFVFTQMLLGLVEQRRPDYLAMTIDSGDETVFRKQIDPNYKANRPPPPPDFHPQEQRILRIVEDAGVPIYAKPGFEADDLIATMVARLRRRVEAGELDVFLVSKDKDLRQVLTDHIKLFDPQSNEEFDAAALVAKLGFSPQQAIDIQTLMGDKVDNVPGVPGVGEKTAVELIKQFGTADEVFRRAAEIKKPKLRENVQKHGHDFARARELVTLKQDVEFDFDPEACAFRGLQVDRLTPHLRELGFNSMLKRLSESASLAARSSNGGGNGAGSSDGSAKTSPPPRVVGDLFSQADTPAEGSDGMRTTDACAYELIDTRPKFEAFLAKLRQQKRFAFDTETDDLGAMKSDVIGMSFSWQGECGYYVPIKGPAGSAHLSREDVLPALKPILEDPAIEKVGHNIKYDVLAMRSSLGVRMRGVAMDTMIAAFVLDAGRSSFGIDALARDLLGIRKITTAEIIGTGRSQVSMDKIDLGRVARYASEDADVCWRLHELLAPKLDATPALRKLHDEIELPLIDVLVEMEFNGVAIDRDILKEQSAALGERIDALHELLMSEAGGPFNPDSPKQLADVLFTRLKLKPVKKTKTGFSTDIEVLEKLSSEHAVPKLILEYRSLVKLKNTYLDNLPEYVNARTGRIHPHFNQIGAATGRLSCSDPNLQNIPIRTDEGRRIRLAFVPGDRGGGQVLLTCDYSQVELRFLAHFTGEPALVRAFEQDEDIHRAVAAEVFGVPLDQVSKDQRGQAKTINFGIIYGVTAQGLARRIDGMTVQSAAKFIETYNQRFPSIQKFMNDCVAHAKTMGYVETINGRRRPLPDINSPVINIRNMNERMAINSVVQGSAADLIKIAMRRVFDRIASGGLKSRMLLQVHDELVFETPAAVAEQEAEIIRAEMAGAMQLRVPLKVEAGWGKNWQEGK